MRWNMCLCSPGWTGPGCHSAVCELPCANSGRCVGPDTCQSPSDYTGPQCLTREYQQRAPNNHTAKYNF
ncbi:hypothetical protein SKAU_G00089010 [Synaphobranchus kaupii]|uniref:EGF-like domain-containing protein n=1 Tax=Synaphobranchus kaupii TaxID=118154 RepID=A0A9Q1FW55_SYNKA|nr:hypothetical protein SKAU_G00089010 [Synaphobranchus kaupii]